MTSSLLAADVLAAYNPTPDEFKPGILGFIFTFGIAVVAVFLARDMMKRIRRLQAGEEKPAGIPITERGDAVNDDEALGRAVQTPASSSAETPGPSGDSAEAENPRA